MKRAIAVAAILIDLAAAAAGEDIDWKQGKLGRLSTLIGTYDYEAVLNDPQVKQAVTQVVGKDSDLLKQNLAVRNPIGFINGNVVLDGLAPHMGGIEMATLWLSIYDGAARAAIVHQGKVTIYAKESEYDHLPPVFRDYVHNVGSNQDREPPAGTRWLK